MKKKLYKDEFYKTRNDGTQYSANVIMRFISEIYEINSAIDIGCGVGTWIRTLKNVNVNTKYIRGVDGEYVNKNYLVINQEEFIPKDLEENIDMEEKFDLAISLEVAEHLSKDRSKSFVNDLTKLSEVILFSAAFPYQGGVGHINEQFLSYWVELFQEHDYEPFDIIRPIIFADKKIPFWYRQNIILFVKKDSKNILEFKKYIQCPILDIVYTEVFMKYYKILEAGKLINKIRRVMAKITGSDKN